jgi:hypothetical protein
MAETLETLIRSRSTILERWVDAVLAGYPAQTAGFLRTERDQFANPVGATISEALTRIFDHLTRDPGGDAIPALEPVVRLWSVQDFAPSQAIGFIFLLKRIVREVVGATPTAPALAGEVAALDSRVDQVALTAVDVYVASRERLSEIKVDEMRRQTALLVRRLQPADNPPAREARGGGEARRAPPVEGGRAEPPHEKEEKDS